jgi:8-oxo-dGTP diphosphatase
MSIPQFGRLLPGRAYPDRPAAFAIIAHEGRIACVRVSLRGGSVRMDLPGGGLDPGETPAAAAVRECGEEAGLKVRIDGEPLVRADHFFVNEEGRTNNTRGCFFQAVLEAAAPELKTEADHELVWLEPAEALRALDRDAHAWALAVWIRGRAES